MLFLLFTFITTVLSATSYIVNVQSELNIRSHPDAQSRSVGKLINGQSVEVISIEGDRAKIDYQGAECYVKATLVIK